MLNVTTEVCDLHHESLNKDVKELRTTKENHEMRISALERSQAAMLEQIKSMTGTLKYIAVMISGIVVGYIVNLLK